MLFLLTIYGLRNPWRFSFDKETADMWIGDVGQNEWEEIDFEAAGDGGHNYGWRCYEGFEQYNFSGCDSAGDYTFPVFVYANSSFNEGCSIIVRVNFGCLDKVHVA